MKRSFICLAALISLSLAACSKEDFAAQPYSLDDMPVSQISADIVAGETTSVRVIGASIPRNSEFIKTLELTKRATQPEGVGKALKEHGADALVNISGGPLQPILPVGSASGDPIAAVQKGQTTASITTYATVADYPHIAISMGQVNGLSVGLLHSSERHGRSRF